MGIDEFNKKGEDLESYYNVEIDQRREIEDARKSKEEEDRKKLEDEFKAELNKKFWKKFLLYSLIFIILILVITSVIYLLINKKSSPKIIENRKIILYDSAHFLRDKPLEYSNFFQELNNSGFDLKVVNSVIDNENLVGVDAIIIPNHKAPYLPNELEAVKNFSNNGGKIIVFGDFTYEANMNMLLSSVLGTQTNLYYCYSDWDALAIGNHSLVNNVKSLKFPASDCINVSDDLGFEAIVFAVPNNITGVKVEDELPVAYVRNSPNKFLILGDSNVCDDDYIDWADNRAFCRNIADWMYE